MSCPAEENEDVSVIKFESRHLGPFAAIHALRVNLLLWKASIQLAHYVKTNQTLIGEHKFAQIKKNGLQKKICVEKDVNFPAPISCTYKWSYTCKNTELSIISSKKPKTPPSIVDNPTPRAEKASLGIIRPSFHLHLPPLCTL